MITTCKSEELGKGENKTMLDFIKYMPVTDKLNLGGLALALLLNLVGIDSLVGLLLFALLAYNAYLAYDANR
jgi:hypothetical protein